VKTHKHQWREFIPTSGLDKVYYSCIECHRRIVLYGDTARAVTEAIKFKLLNDKKYGE
jgi:hypothetical protein